MGCDIHVHTEIKVNGKWEHYGHPNTPRSYSLFALMAGVRNHDAIEPISPPKGMPEDASEITRLSYESYGSDGHSHSWLDSKEITVLEDRWIAMLELNNLSTIEFDLEWKYFGYLEGNSWAGFAKYPKERPKWIEDVRFVFWFDN